MKQLEKWSQLLILDIQKRLKHLFKTVFGFGIWDFPEQGASVYEINNLDHS